MSSSSVHGDQSLNPISLSAERLYVVLSRNLLYAIGSLLTFLCTCYYALHHVQMLILRKTKVKQVSRNFEPVVFDLRIVTVPLIQREFHSEADEQFSGNINVCTAHLVLSVGRVATIGELRNE